MKKIFSVLFLFSFAICLTTQLFSQGVTSATWPLTANSSAAAPIGNVKAQPEFLNNMVVRNYFHGTCQKSAPDAGGTWPAESSENSTRYLQFAISPTEGNSLKATALSFAIGWAGTSGHMFANAYYSISPEFSPRTQLNKDGVLALNNKDSILISYTFNVPVSTGHTFYVRIYPWNNKAVDGKNCGLANLIISGTTIPGTISEKVENEVPKKIEQKLQSSTAAQSVLPWDSVGVPFTMPEIQAPTFPDRAVSIIDHGAVGDGQTMNTKAFAEAIQACAQAGGGKVVVPAGVWLTGPIRFQSNINLQVERGAVILFSRNRNDFPVVPMPTPTSKNYGCEPPIHGYHLENVAITGDGIVDGSGEVWRPMKKEKYTANQWKRAIESGGAVTEDGKMWWPSQQVMQWATSRSMNRDMKSMTKDDSIGFRDFARPNMVDFYGCKKLLLDGPTFQNSPKFNIHPSQCENVLIRNIKVLNPWNAQNGDGIDLASCHNVIVSHCMVDVGDDAICLKPGTIEKGKDWTAACENILITDCVVYHGHGGFVIGSETYGGTRNIMVRNCSFIGTDVGLRFKSDRKRGGLTENIYIDGIQMKDIPTQAILFDMYYEDDKPEAGETRASAPVTERTPRFQKCYIKNVVCNGANQAIFIEGLPEQFVRGIELTNVTISARKGVSCIDAEGLQFTNTNILIERGPVFDIDNARNITIKNNAYTPGAELFIKVEGKESGNIQLLNSDISKAKKGIELGKDVSAAAVIQK